MMRKLIQYFVAYPILANIIIGLTVIAGVVSIFNTKKTFFPTRSTRNIVIEVVYPGASPEEMEEGVTQKIEEAIKSIAGIDEITSNSSENSANVNIETLQNYDIDEVFTEVKNAVDRINSFPGGAEKPVIYKRKPQSTAMWLGITGDVDLMALKKFGEKVEDDLLNSGVVSQINLMGINEREISIEVSEDDLSRYGLTFDEVAAAVRSNNRDISAGSLKTKEEEIMIRSNAKEDDAAVIGRIVLRTNADGSRLLLSDVAMIEERFTDVPNKWTLNGQRTVFLQVNKLEDEDLQEISQFVTNYAEEFNEANPGVNLIITYNFFDMLSQRLEMLLNNGVVGLLLVLIALGFFLNLKLSFWVAWGIPSSFLGMFIIGTMAGLTINMISLFGMIVVIGILVDDGIVIAENIYTHFEKTGNPYKAAVDGTMEVLPAVATSVTTTIVAFSPLLILESFEFLSDMALVVITCLGFSLLEAFFVLPAHLASPHVLKKMKPGTTSTLIRNKIESVINFMRFKLYGNMLKFTMKYRYLSLAFVVSLFPILFGLLGGGFIKATFFPNIPFNNFQVNVVFKPGTREMKVEEYLEKFETSIWELNDELKTKYDIDEDYITFTFSGTGNTMNGSDVGSHAGGVNIFYKELQDAPFNSFDLVRMLSEKIGEVPEAEKFTIGGEQRFGKPVSVRLLGSNLDELNTAKTELKNSLKEINDLKDIQDNVAIGARELRLDLDQKAYFMGLTREEVVRQIRQGFFGEEVQRLQKGSDEVKVWVRYPNSGRISLGQLEDMKIKAGQGQEYTLNEIASYEMGRGIAGIRHIDAERAVTVEADLVDPYAEVPPIVKKVKDDIIPQLEAKFPTVKFEFGGQSKESAKAFQEIMLYFGGAFLIIFFLIMLTFKSFYQAVLIMSMIPLGWIGAAIGHGVEGFPISLLSAWGMVALSGVIINDAVVFLAKYNTNIGLGMKAQDAAYDAGLSRFRAIMLTSITTVAGLYPLILEKSFQAQFLIPMAISVAYGVLIGTFIILLFFPVIIMYFNDVRVLAKWLWTGRKPSPEEVERAYIDAKRQEMLVAKNVDPVISNELQNSKPKNGHHVKHESLYNEEWSN